MSDSSKSVLDFIKSYKRSNQGTSPTLDEIADNLGMSKTNAKYWVDKLHNTGRIEYRGTRNIFILDPEEVT